VVKAFENPVLLARFEEYKVRAMKYCAVTSAVQQPNDLAKSHSMLHKATKNAKYTESPLVEAVRQDWLAIEKILFTNKPGKQKANQFIKILGATRLRFSASHSIEVVQAGHDKSGWADIKININKAMSGYLFEKDVGILEGYKIVCDREVNNMWENLQLTDEDFKRMGIPLSDAEKIEEENGATPRDMRSLNERRAFLMCCPNAVGGRKKLLDEINAVKNAERAKRDKKVATATKKREEDEAKLMRKNDKLRSEFLISERRAGLQIASFHDEEFPDADDWECDSCNNRCEALCV
jgi:hypothetical protein